MLANLGENVILLHIRNTGRRRCTTRFISGDAFVVKTICNNIKKILGLPNVFPTFFKKKCAHPHGQTHHNMKKLKCQFQLGCISIKVRHIIEFMIILLSVLCNSRCYLSVVSFTLDTNELCNRSNQLGLLTYCI